MAKALVDNPDEVHVSQHDGEHGGTVYELRVADGDLGKVIGKRGRTARAMRNIMHAASSKDHSRAVLDIVE